MLICTVYDKQTVISVAKSEFFYQVQFAWKAGSVIFDIVGPLNTFLQTPGLDLALCVAEADIAEAKHQTLRESRSTDVICDAKVKAEML